MSLLLFSLFASATASCLHGTDLMPRKVKSDAQVNTVEVSSFGYTGDLGPLNWHNLDPAYTVCAQGDSQSPINFDNSTSFTTSGLVIDIPNVNHAELLNLGSTIEVVTNGTTIVDNTTFNLAQFHFHTPSEHRINEEYYPMEMHMVHQAADGSGAITVLGVVFQLSSNTTTQLLDGVTQHLEEVAVPGSIAETGELDFDAVIEHFSSCKLYSYSGSLTTPPCTQGINFFIAQEPMPIDVETFNELKRVMKFNSRVTQNTPGQTNLLDSGCASNSTVE